jgi:hypothetical protein
LSKCAFNPKDLSGRLVGNLEQKNMDDLLNKLNELTEEEKKQVQQFCNKKKPSISFARATLNDCIRADGLGLDVCYIEPIGLPVPKYSSYSSRNHSAYS